MLSLSDFHKYQIKAVNFAKEEKKCALLLDMGLGKTVITLTVLVGWIKEKSIGKTLIIAPLRVANTVWKQEAENWEHLQDLKIEICTGTVKQRTKSFNKDADIFVTNRENIVWITENLGWKWDTVIIDESSSFKSSKSQRFRALKRCKKVIKNIILLTGTPAPNGLMDLWSQLFLIDQGERLGSSVTKFREKYFDKVGYMGYTFTPKKEAENMIKEKIKDVCLSMSTEDHIDLPENIKINKYVEFPPKVFEQYEELEKEFILSLKSGEIEVINAAVLSSKLLQMCNGFLYETTESKPITHIFHDEKIKALEEIVEDNANENFLVAYNYKADLERLKIKFPKAKELSKSGKELEDWNEGKIKMLLVHPASAGHGLNLQKGGSIIVWFGLNWSLELYQQLNKRLHRQGQKKTVRTIHLIAKNGMDEKVVKALEGKAKTQQDLIDYLKRL